MSADQYWQTVGQWAEAEAAQELEARRIERANEVLQEMAEAREREEAEYIASLESKFPILKGWK
jgi:hypothetical protein